MKRSKQIDSLICGLVLFTTVSCLNFNFRSESALLLKQAQELMESRPDSAMLLLDSIIYPEKNLTQRNYMNYLVVNVQARHKNYLPIDKDTLIFQARDYFMKHDENVIETALACFYSGCVYRDMQKYDEAMQEYKNAQKYVYRTTNNNLTGLIEYNIGDLLYEQGLYREALDSYLNSEKMYNEIPAKQVQCLSAAGRMFVLLNNTDSAIFLFNKGLKIAETEESKSLQSLLTQNLSVTYKEMGRFEQAEKYLKQSFQFNEDSIQLPLYYLNFAELYNKMHISDSVDYYTQKLLDCSHNSNDSNLRAKIYKYLAEYFRKNGNFDKAFDFISNYTNEIESITEFRLLQSVYEVQQKYDYEVVKNQHIQQQAKLQKWLIISLTFFIISGATFTVHSIKQKNKLLKMRENIETLRQMAKDLEKSHNTTLYKREKNFVDLLHQKEKDLRELLLWKFDVIKKAALLTASISNNEKTEQLLKKFHKIVYNETSEHQWNIIQNTFDQVNENISEIIREKFPNLNNIEYRICLLAFARMSVKEIALILHMSPNTVQTYRTNLRKKLEINNPNIDISFFLKNILNT